MGVFLSTSPRASQTAAVCRRGRGLLPLPAGKEIPLTSQHSGCTGTITFADNVWKVIAVCKHIWQAPGEESVFMLVHL